MAKYKPIDMVKHYQGKICQHSDTHFQERNRTLCTYTICNPRNMAHQPILKQEIATHNKFRQAIQAVAALTEEQIAAYKTAFEKQLKSPKPKYSYLRNYMIAMEYAKLN